MIVLSLAQASHVRNIIGVVELSRARIVGVNGMGKIFE
jgi:hypothetical protein